MEKEVYEVKAPEYADEGAAHLAPPHGGDDKGTAVSEAADLYGDIQTAEDMGYVHRGLKSRHIQFIALGGTIGTGLFLGIGKAFSESGPLSLLLGYTFTGCAIYAMVGSLSGTGSSR